MVRSRPQPCEWQDLAQALNVFAANVSGTQGSEHIRPLQWYVACRLVLEGGFHPDDIRPRPPFRFEGRRAPHLWRHDPASAGHSERKVLGGLKTKNVDVVVSLDGIGPAVAISLKGTLNAFRNLTNRMEEAVGDCANLHISYPTLVYGFLHVLRANREGPDVPPNDVAIRTDGSVVDGIYRYRDVLARLSGRADIRDDATKYEAVAMALIDLDEGKREELLTHFPGPDSPLRFDGFFPQLYQQFDHRFVFAAPALEGKTRRLEWREDSPALTDWDAVRHRYEPRFA